MGCCASALENEADETELPPPMLGKNVKVKCTHKGATDGMFLSDIGVCDLTDPNGGEEGTPWMLLDGAYPTFTEAEKPDVDEETRARMPNFTKPPNFYLKYKAKGAESSTTLGMINMQQDHDYMSYAVR